jgi:dihydrofolate synthase/folylpolyglutamate synthase
VTPYLDALRDICQPIRTTEFPRSLQPLRQLLAQLDNPYQKFPSVVVTGSVGKGTTCHNIARLLRAASLKVGLFTSPHLHSFRERFRINGEMISQEAFVEGIAVLKSVLGPEMLPLDNGAAPFSTFELATILTLWWFAREQVDIAVLEVSMGGRWDAVNVVPNVLAVFTPIESEHLTMLGGSMQSIAWRKAGIIKPGGHAITCRQSFDVLEILRHEADHKQATLNQVNTGLDSNPQETAAYLAHGAYQDLLKRRVIARRALNFEVENVRLPGRLERISFAGHDVLIDGGHTHLAAQALRDMIDVLVHPSEQVRLVIGMLADKSVSSYLDALDAPNFHIVLTHAPGHRAADPNTLAEQSSLSQAAVEIIPDLTTALMQVNQSSERLFVVGGSLRMVAAAHELYGLLAPDMLAESMATRTIFDGDDYMARLHRIPPE